MTDIKTTPLCCMINSQEKCWLCNGKMCQDHLGKETVEGDFWCENCLDNHPDCYDRIDKLSEDVVNLGNALDEWYEVKNHWKKCKTCLKEKGFCNDLAYYIARAQTVSK